MNYFDPARPTGLSGRPQYCTPAGRGIAALPRLQLGPSNSGWVNHWDVSVMLLIGHVTGREFSITVRDVDIPALLGAWEHNPEAVLRDRFGYTYTPAVRSAPAPATTLEDLGL